MENELKELGNRLMKLMHAECMSDDELYISDVMDGMSNIEKLAVMFVTGTVGDAFGAVYDEVGECMVDGTWARR